MAASSSEAPWSGAADNDNTPRKRLRISRACDTCRRRKERCDGTEPSCDRCTTNGRTCSYYPSRKRGLPPGYVRSLEIMLGMLFYSFQGSADLIRSVVHGETCETPLELARPVESLLDTWRESTAFEQLQRALASAPPADDDDLYLQDLNQKWTSRFNTLPRAHNHTKSRGCDAASEPTVPCLPDPMPGRPTPMSCARQSPKALSPLDGVSPVLPNDWPKLVNVYLVNTHTWLPVVQKFILFRCANMVSCSGLSGDASNPLSTASGDVASLWAVLALASHQADLPKTLAVSTHPLSTDLEHSVPLSAQLYATAKSLLLNSQAGFQTGHIHASLVLALREIAVGAWTDAWLFVCRALFMASSIGIIPHVGNGLNCTMNDAEKRLFMGCFVLDGIVASALSVRPNLHKEDLQYVGGISVDGLEEWEPCDPGWGPSPSCEPSTDPGRLLSTFNSLGDLVCLLKDYDHSCGSPELRNKLIQDFTDFQKRLPPSSADPPFSVVHSSDDDPTITGFRSQTPPHILHLNTLAGTLYVMLKSPASHMNPDQSHQNAPRLDTASTLYRMLHYMQSMSKETFLPILGRYIPTLLTIVKFLGRDSSLSSSEFLLPPGYLEDTRPQEQSTRLPPLPSTMTRLGSPAHMQAEEEGCSYQTRSLNAVLTTGDIPQSPADRDPAPSASMHATDSANSQIVLPSSSEAAAVEPTGHHGNFEQLDILEMANWNTMSVDFMENLGISRDDTTLDVSSFFFSGD